MSRSDCASVAEELVAYADGELDRETHARVDAHVGACLACRRELAALAKMDDAMRALPRLEPSADFAERMRARLEQAHVEPDVRRPWRRAAQWGLPALAAAAVVALVLRSTVVPPGGAPAPEEFAPAPLAIAPDSEPASEPPARVAGAPEAVPARPAEVASAPAAVPVEAGPEDVPPELLEHPEFFLRLPVVRRLDKLEHFEEVRRHADPDGGDGSVG